MREDNLSHSSVRIGLEHNKIHMGKFWTFGEEVSISSGATNIISWKWRDMSSMSRQERDTILHKAAEAAMIDYEGGSDLMSFTINGDIFDESKSY